MDYYTVLSLFKNIITISTFLRSTNSSGEILAKVNNIRILAIMVSTSGTIFKGIIPNKRCRWNTGSIYVVKHINDVLAVKGELE